MLAFLQFLCEITSRTRKPTPGPSLAPRSAERMHREKEDRIYTKHPMPFTPSSSCASDQDVIHRYVNELDEVAHGAHYEEADADSLGAARKVLAIIELDKMSCFAGRGAVAGRTYILRNSLKSEPQLASA